MSRVKGLPARDHGVYAALKPCGHSAPCGCKYGGACCVVCALPACVFESGEPGRNTGRLAIIDDRRMEARRMHRKLALGVVEIARMLGISTRTVMRYLEGNQ